MARSRCAPCARLRDSATDICPQCGSKGPNADESATGKPPAADPKPDPVPPPAPELRKGPEPEPIPEEDLPDELLPPPESELDKIERLATKNITHAPTSSRRVHTMKTLDIHVGETIVPSSDTNVYRTVIIISENPCNEEEFSVLQINKDRTTKMIKANKGDRSIMIVVDLPKNKSWEEHIFWVKADDMLAAPQEVKIKNPTPPSFLDSIAGLL